MRRSIKITLRAYAVLCALFALLAVTSLCKAETFEYKVTGINLKTQERVVGHITDSAQNGTVSGMIWDRMGVYPVEGIWAGKGRMRLYCTLSSFTVHVVEE